MTLESKFTPEALVLKSESAPVVFTKFTLLIDKYGEDVVYCFVEGYDMPYYLSPVRMLLCKEPIEVPCHGKDNVISANKFIENKPEYAHYTKRYFVDRDYTNNDAIPDTVYITDGYAIENYYLTDRCVSMILRNEFKFDIVDHVKEFDACIKLFHQEHEKFENAIILFNAWYCCLHQDASWNQKDVSLDATFPVAWLDCNIGSFIASYTLMDIQTKYPQAPIIAEEKISEMEEVLRAKGWFYMRGKYEMQFLFTFLQYLKNEPKKSRAYTVAPCSIPFYLNTMISTFSQYADQPESLRYYIINGKRSI